MRFGSRQSRFFIQSKFETSSPNCDPVIQISCKNHHILRVPSDKGVLHVTCPVCHDSFSWNPNAVSTPNHNKVAFKAWVLSKRPIIATFKLLLIAALALTVMRFSRNKDSESSTGGGANQLRQARPLPPAPGFDRPSTAEPPNYTANPSSRGNLPLTSDTPPTNPDDHLADVQTHQNKTIIASVKPLPLPEHGTTVRWFKGSHLPSLTIIVPDDGHYYVKIENWETKEAVATIFIHSGRKANINLPAGSYRIKCARGDMWYGTQYLFGAQTQCSIVTKQISCSVTKEYNRTSYSNTTITLIKQTHGNLETEPIKIEKF